jgi:hypothetical protein
MGRKPLVAALALVVLANAVTIAMIARNRSGTPEATLQMTERELRLPPPGMENSGIALHLRWRRPSDVAEEDYPPPAWLDRAKLASVGFDCSVDPGAADARRHYGDLRMPARLAYAALEYRPEQTPVPAERPAAADQASPGAAFRQAPLSDSDRTRLSRLLAVDIGPSAADLRRRYPDRSRFVVVPAAVRLIYLDPERTRRAAALAGDVVTLFPGQVTVPREHRALLERLQKGTKPDDTPMRRLAHDPRYAVTVHWGRSLEPWIVGVAPLGQ